MPKRPSHPSLPPLGSFLALFAIIALFGIVSPSFLTARSAAAIMEASAIPLIVVMPLTFVMLQGSIDFSVEGNVALCGMVVALLLSNTVNQNDFGWVAIGAALATGLAVGSINGVIFVKLRIPSLIVTLAMWFVALGFASLLFPAQQPVITDSAFLHIARVKILGLSPIVYVSIGAMILGLFVENYTRIGRLSYAIGSNESIARLAGLNVPGIKFGVYALAGLMFGLAGVLTATRLGVGNPRAGEGLLFPAISAAVIGGTLLSGGKGGVLHSAVGVLILEVLKLGMIQIGTDPLFRQVIEGSTIIIAVAIGTFHYRQRTRVIK